MQDSSSSSGDFPRTWDWNEDGELVGAYRETRLVTTKDGPRKLVEFKHVDTGEPVSVWLSAQVLKNKFVEELKRRVVQGRNDFEPGENIRISRGEKRPSQTGNGYWPFKVEFEFAAKLSAADVLLADEPEDTDDTTTDDDVPF
jgi:hypothetical protein